MKTLRSIFAVLIAVALVAAPLVACAAGEESGSGSGRHIWDTVWRLINFAVLVFVIYKYGRTPLMNFLRKHGESVGERLDKSKSLLAEAESEYQEVEARLNQIEDLIAQHREITLGEADRAKQRILDDANQNSELILADARELAGTRINQARDAVKAELVENGPGGGRIHHSAADRTGG